MGVNFFRRDDRDPKFVLFEMLDLERLLRYEAFKDFTLDDFKMILDEGLKVAREVAGPTLQDGDQQGLVYEDGRVKVPASFHDCWKVLSENGWFSLAVSPEFGGQGLPLTIYGQVAEYLISANSAMTIYSGLAVGAAHLIENFGTGEDRALFCEKMCNGVWGGTMCLTEPDAGIGRGLPAGPRPCPIPRPAIPRIYKIEGNKRFITCGDQNLTENIIHLVLARIEGGPPGTKGISLFIVPKVWVNPDGSLGEPNDVYLHRHRTQDGDPRILHRLAQLRRKRPVPRDPAGRTAQRHGQDVPDDERGPHGLRGPVAGPGEQRLRCGPAVRQGKGPGPAFYQPDGPTGSGSSNTKTCAAC